MRFTIIHNWMAFFYLVKVADFLQRFVIIVHSFCIHAEINLQINVFFVNIRAKSLDIILKQVQLQIVVNSV